MPDLVFVLAVIFALSPWSSHPAGPDASAQARARLLTAQGYRSVAIESVADIYSAVRVSVGGRTLRLILDTGAADTYLDPERTKALLKWVENPAHRKNPPEGDKLAYWWPHLRSDAR